MVSRRGPGGSESQRCRSACPPYCSRGGSSTALLTSGGGRGPCTPDPLGRCARCGAGRDRGHPRRRGRGRLAVPRRRRARVLRCVAVVHGDRGGDLLAGHGTPHRLGGAVRLGRGALCALRRRGAARRRAGAGGGRLRLRGDPQGHLTGVHVRGHHCRAAPRAPPPEPRRLGGRAARDVPRGRGVAALAHCPAGRGRRSRVVRGWDVAEPRARGCPVGVQRPHRPAGCRRHAGAATGASSSR